MQTNTQNQPLPEYFYAIEYDTIRDIVSDESMEKVLSIVKKSHHGNEIESIEKLKTIEGLLPELSGSFAFDLSVNVQILSQLVDGFIDTYKSKTYIDKETQKKDYIQLLNNISHFIYTGIEQTSKVLRNKIDWAIEYEESKK